MTAKFVPITQTLTNFFKLPEVLNEIKSYMNELEVEEKNGILSNFIKGSLWIEKKTTFEGKFVIPIFLYYDDIEVNNPLGLHATIQKLGVVYFSLPVLPPQYRSRLENIFFTLLFHASDRSNNSSGNYNIFRKLIEELNCLQNEGLFVTVDGRVEKIYVALGLFLADNLGLHKSIAKSTLIEKQTLLRKISDYESDIDKGISLSGLKENSVWNDIKFFHVLSNYAVDLFNDFYEGICRTDMALILHYYIIQN